MIGGVKLNVSAKESNSPTNPNCSASPKKARGIGYLVRARCSDQTGRAIK
jgi:hypothetical protein